MLILPAITPSNPTFLHASFLLINNCLSIPHLLLPKKVSIEDVSIEST